MGGLDGDLLGGNCFFSGLGVLMIMTEGWKGRHLGMTLFTITHTM
jgi:hypothetical protein